MCPLRGHTHSFNNSGWGWHIVPPAWERRSRRTGISHGESSRRPTGSANPVELDESERTRGDIVWSLEMQTSLPGLSQIFSKSAPPPRCGASIPQASAPVSTGCLLPDWGTQGWKLPSRRAVSLWSTRGSAAPACTGGVSEDPLGGWCKRPLTYCLCILANDGLSGLGESVSMLEILAASPGNWCATWDGDLPTDPGRSGHSWPPPSPWGRHPSLALRDVKEPPTPGLVTGTTVSSTCLRHESIAAWPWSCEMGCPSGKTLWSWATTARVSCAACQKLPRWTQLPSDPTAFEKALQWATGLLSLSRILWGLTRYEQRTIAPASWLNPTPRPDKWSSVLEEAHFTLR